MTNYLGPATVTATLRELVQEAVQAAVPGATVGVGYPQKPPAQGTPEVYLYLYQAVHDGALTNYDLPTMAAGGSYLKNPQAVIDLLYLIVFYGDTDLAAERMLGSVAATLHARPILTRGQVEKAIHSGMYHGALDGSDLAEQQDCVRLTPVRFDLDQLSKLWTVFNQTTHRVSLGYKASPVLLETKKPHGRALPAGPPAVGVRAGKIPSISAVVPPAVTYEDHEGIVLEGRNLGASGLTVYVGGAPVASTNLTDTRRVISALPPSLAAGVQPIEVTLPTGSGSGTPSVRYPVGELLLKPAITDPPSYGVVPDPRSDGEASLETIQVPCLPLPAVAQGCTLWLNPASSPGDTAAARSLSPPLSFALSGSLVSELPARTGDVPADVIAGFQVNGILLSPGATLTATDAGLWTLSDPGGGTPQRFTLWAVGGSLTVFFGLAPSGPPTTVAFTVDTRFAGRGSPFHLDPGDYLVRIQTGGVTSDLRATSTSGGRYAAPSVHVGKGRS